MGSSVNLSSIVLIFTTPVPAEEPLFPFRSQRPRMWALPLAARALPCTPSAFWAYRRQSGGARWAYASWTSCSPMRRQGGVIGEHFASGSIWTYRVGFIRSQTSSCV